MSRFNITQTPLVGLKCIERQHLGDTRGFLSRLFCAQELARAGWAKPIAQINHTYTAQKGTVRGLHFQHPPYAEMKLVSCTSGAVWDVAVDIRAGSPTFLQWYAQELSAENRRALLIPEGFAHGFQTLTDDAEVVYLVSAPYAPDFEDGLHPLDVKINVNWPLEISELSERDKKHRTVSDMFIGIEL